MIGYTDRRREQESRSGARFGYLFGPKAIIDPEENQLVYRQVAASHAIYADVSVPAWWPGFQLNIRSAWAANWHDGTKILNKTTTDRNVSVRLRPQRFDIDSLTSFLAGQPLLNAFESVEIQSVFPDHVSACVGDIEFVVKGRNLWRVPVVFLRGKRHKSVSVLPDMGGIAVTFNIRGLPKPPHALESAPLIVWTSFGRATYDIRIRDSVNNSPCPKPGAQSGAPVLRAAAPRWVTGPDTKLKVELVSPLPSTARGVKVIAQLIPRNSAPLASTESTGTTVEMPGRWYEGTIAIAFAGFSPDAVDGAPLRVGLRYKSSDLGAEKDVWAARSIVYYSSLAASQFKLKTMSIGGFGDKVTLAAPMNLATAYPKFVSAQNAFAARVTAHDKISIRPTADWQSQRGEVVLSLSKTDSGDSDAEKIFNKDRCEKDLTLQLSMTDAVGPEKPGQSWPVVLKQRQC